MLPFSSSAALILPTTGDGAGAPTVAARDPDKADRAGWKWRVDRVTLSRIEIEWLVACYHGSARLMPRNVYERLKSLGFVDDGANITSAGKHWLDEWRRQPPG